MTALLLALALALLGRASLAAQDLPSGPPPAPTGEAALPALLPVHERTLSSGATLVVVPEDEVPLVTVSVVLPGGSAADPPGREGAARLLAELLPRGAGGHSSAEVAGRLARMGADLTVSAGSDWIIVTLTLLAPELTEGLALLADLVMRPTLPESELSRAREAAAARLEGLARRPDVTAERALVRHVYGDHPYGRMESPGTLRSLDREDLVDLHAQTFGPHGARVVVAGAVDPDAVETLFSDAFQGWRGAPSAPPSLRPIPPPPHATRIVVVHRPGSPGVAVRVGAALVPGDHPDWPVLELTERVLARRIDERLFETLRDAGASSGATATLQRRPGWGLFQVRAETTHALAYRTVDALLAELRQAATVPPGPDAVGRARGYLVGSFPLRMETAQQVAAGWLTLRLLGVEGTALQEEPRRIAALGPQDVREAAERHLDPDRMTVVVAGDATLLRGALASLGDVSVVDAGGRPLAFEELVPPDRSVDLDASILEPLAREALTLTYRVRVGERQVGRVTRALGMVDEGIRYQGEAVVGDGRIEQAVTFTIPAFELVSSTAGEGSGGGGDPVMDVRVEGGRLVGRLATRAGAAASVDMPLPRGTLVGDMLELAVVLAPLTGGMEIRVPVARPETGAVESVAVRVEGREAVTVPAGTFDTWRVHIGGAAPQRVWARVEAPHLLVRLEPVGQPLVLELVGLGPGEDAAEAAAPASGGQR